jgi:hypothetical protein
MFKQIPGNNNYVISLTQDIRNLDGTRVSIPITNDKIDIDFYGVYKKDVCLKWLSLIAHFETKLPSTNVKDLFNVFFVDANISFFKSYSGKVMCFKRPIKLIRDGQEYRVIPGYTNYAISCTGKIIETFSNSNIKIVYNLKRFNAIVEYPSVYIYSPEKSSYKYVMVHRLVALAWLENPNLDFVLRPIVNHKDGNKKNYYYKNLEWCSFYENNIHAVNNNLRSDNIKCKVREFKSGVVRNFNSLAQACGFMGLNQKALRTNTLHLVKSRLINDRYEFKLESDTTPWFYENKTEKVKTGRYVITVTDPEGVVETFYDTRDFKSKFKIWNCPKISDLINRAKNENLGYKFEVSDNYNSSIIQALDISTNNILETKNIVEMSKKTNIRENLISACLKEGEHRVKNGFAFRYKSDNEWDRNFIEREKKHTRVLVVDVFTKQQQTFASIRQAAKVLKVNRTSIKNSLINSIPLKNCLITEIQE